MSRKKQAEKRVISPDSVYNSRLVAKLTNYIMEDGKKAKACNIVNNAFVIIEEKTKEKPIFILEKAMKNIMPNLELKSRRIGGSNYQIPFEVKPNRKIILAFQWLVKAANDRKEKTITEKLALEIIDAANNVGKTVKKKEEIHRMAEANKAFSHYRW